MHIFKICSGNGQFYCIECARYFIDEKSLHSHRSSKGIVVFSRFKNFCLTFSKQKEVCISEVAGFPNSGNHNILMRMISFQVHRQRLKRLREPAYTQREAEESVGLKTTTSV